jgi:hypothetical protein
MVTVGGSGLEAFAFAKEMFCSHDVEHSLVIGFVSTPVKLSSNTPVTIALKFQSNLMNCIPKLDIRLWQWLTVFPGIV